MQIETCKVCGAPVVYVQTIRGPKLPVEPERLDGDPAHPAEVYDRRLHQRHYEVCPNSDYHAIAGHLEALSKVKKYGGRRDLDECRARIEARPPATRVAKEVVKEALEQAEEAVTRREARVETAEDGFHWEPCDDEERRWFP
jgi:hypothetical protein